MKIVQRFFNKDGDELFDEEHDHIHLIRLSFYFEHGANYHVEFKKESEVKEVMSGLRNISILMGEYSNGR